MPLHLFGPGTASGTFDYFTEAVNGTARASRTDYTPSEDDNVIVQGVASNTGGMGYFGLAYLRREPSSACMRWRSTTAMARSSRASPTPSTARYAPLSRPIFIYVNAAALRRPQVQQFVQYYVNNAARISQPKWATSPLPASAYQTYLQRAQRRTQGTAFGGRQAIGVTIEEVIARPLMVEPVQQ